ncbi:MAG: endonuclease/exonuclease/phosphatase family protein [Burkholderiales bacterium]
MSIRLGTYNVENLFRRARILNMRDEKETGSLLSEVAKLQKLLDRQSYTDAIKDDVFALSAKLVQYIDVRVDLGSLGAWKKEPPKTGATGYRVYKSCSGRGDWIGEITFKYSDFSDQQRMNTAAVVKALNADVLCLIEVEGLNALEKFNRDALGKMYAQYLLIDSPNDPRGIDVGCMSRFPIENIRTHIFDKFGSFQRVFSRDCLEVEIALPSGKPLVYLLNHFKSQRSVGPGEAERSAEKRKAQASRVAEILNRYDLTKDFVAVAGDLNEDTSNQYQSLAPLLEVKDLFPVVDPKAPKVERWTHYFEGGKKGEKLSQLDYLLVSKTLHDRMTGVGFERRGIFNIDTITAKEGAPPVTPFDTVTAWDESASDHAGLVAEFDV